MGRKRSKISKTNGFQKGNKPWNKDFENSKLYSLKKSLDLFSNI
jgi:hypothetical protein